MDEGVRWQVPPLRREAVCPADPRDVRQAHRPRPLHGARLGALDEPKPGHEPAAAVRQKVAHVLAAGFLAEHDVAVVEAAVEDEIDHERILYMNTISGAMPIRAAVPVGLLTGVRNGARLSEKAGVT